jgi:hypothetical protein
MCVSSKANKLSGIQSRQLRVDGCGPLLASKKDESTLGLIDRNRKRIREYRQDTHEFCPARPDGCHPIQWDFRSTSLDIEFVGLEYEPLVREVQPTTHGLHPTLHVRTAVSNQIFVDIQVDFHACLMLESGRPAEFRPE